MSTGDRAGCGGGAGGGRAEGAMAALWPWSADADELATEGPESLPHATSARAASTGPSNRRRTPGDGRGASASQQGREGPDRGDAAEDRHADAPDDGRPGQLAFTGTLRRTHQCQHVSDYERAAEGENQEEQEIGPAEQHFAGA